MKRSHDTVWISCHLQFPHHPPQDLSKSSELGWLAWHRSKIRLVYPHLTYPHYDRPGFDSSGLTLDCPFLIFIRFDFESTESQKLRNSISHDIRVLMISSICLLLPHNPTSPHSGALIAETNDCALCTPPSYALFAVSKYCALEAPCRSHEQLVAAAPDWNAVTRVYTLDYYLQVMS